MTQNATELAGLLVEQSSHAPSAAALPRLDAGLIAAADAIARMRQGRSADISHDGHVMRLWPVESLTLDDFEGLRQAYAGRLNLIITGTRAEALDLGADADEVRVFRLNGHLTHMQLRRLVDPSLPGLVELSKPLQPASLAAPLAGGAVRLAKLAHLLPAVLSAELGDNEAEASPSADVRTLRDYPKLIARTLQVVSHARVPLHNASHTKLAIFRPGDGGVEHMAITVGEPDFDQPVLCRLHSECFTGDVLGSMRCDCGEQLQGAIARMHEAGGGVLLYLRQEGRGIGLANKMRAYRLQDRGLDTVEANMDLGFEDDERQWYCAAHMLRLLGVRAVNLMTNNPNKVEAMRSLGVDVRERVAHQFEPNEHNRRYLRTKALRSGHMFGLDALQ
ncbi:MAG: GTP cyclohydrolase II [Geminicoccaceae bacterium]